MASLAIRRCSLRGVALTRSLGIIRGRAPAPRFYTAPANDEKWTKLVDDYKSYLGPIRKESPRELFANPKPAKGVTLHGSVDKKRLVSSKLGFLTVTRDAAGIQVPIVIQGKDLVKKLHQIPLFSAVSITGDLVEKPARAAAENAPPQYELLAESVRLPQPLPQGHRPHGARQLPRLVTVPSAPLPARVQAPAALVREWMQSTLSGAARRHEYGAVTTPMLFKSTPEGAREFVVPTRTKGRAYALVQSPQQYKQALMASGVRGYQQFAVCFRDEDLRADRQPEFMQFDLEKSYADGQQIISDVENMVRDTWGRLREDHVLCKFGDSLVPVQREHATSHGAQQPETIDVSPITSDPFPRLTYHEAMKNYGSDKPDLRIPGKVCSLHSHPDILESQLT